MPTVDSAGVPIHYGVIGTGAPILLVHGYASSFEGNWGQSGWVDFLLAQGRQVVGVDTRGHGLSGRPYDPCQGPVERRRSWPSASQRWWPIESPRVIECWLGVTSFPGTAWAGARV